MKFATMVIELNQLSTAEKQYYLQHVIGPRPICFASTIDKKGIINLSPFSFFNMVSSEPPVVIFSPSRRVRDGSTKHSLQNVLEVPEVVINIVTYDMVQQVSLASCEYPKETDEFIKAGFTKQPAQIVKPPMVAESKVNMECKVIEVKPLGEKAGAGQLVICEVLVVHIDDSLFNHDHKIIQENLELVARLGGDWYCKVSKENLFKVPKPNVELGIGIDNLPDVIKSSKILTGNNLGQLANVTSIPTIQPSFEDDHLKNIIQYYSVDPDELEKELHTYASKLLNQGKTDEAWQVLLSNA
jgi:flavin reductase (DIM6/NTAB) family NADH-FMN oxidoreductase RutF